jgi:hypothetical protein
MLHSEGYTHSMCIVVSLYRIPGTHVKHNEATGDNVGPLIVSIKKEE